MIEGWEGGVARCYARHSRLSLRLVAKNRPVKGTASEKIHCDFSKTGGVKPTTTYSRGASGEARGGALHLRGAGSARERACRQGQIDDQSPSVRFVRPSSDMLIEQIGQALSRTPN